MIKKQLKYLTIFWTTGKYAFKKITLLLCLARVFACPNIPRNRLITAEKSPNSLSVEASGSVFDLNRQMHLSVNHFPYNLKCFLFFNLCSDWLYINRSFFHNHTHQQFSKYYVLKSWP